MNLFNKKNQICNMQNKWRQEKLESLLTCKLINQKEKNVKEKLKYCFRSALNVEHLLSKIISNKLP
jgi:hypothetical protein